jgi:uncharacterized LabA/DUF88 family protein
MSTYPFNQQYSINNRGNTPSPEQDQVALFIDWDNLVISNYADRGGNRPDLEVLVRRAQQYGTVVIARAYAEWNITTDRLEVYKAGIEPIYAPVFHADRDLSGQTSRGKSLADPVMVTDCIDFLHLLPQIGTYVLVTGDKDMVPAVRLARLRGRRVVIIGPDYVANVLQQVSDEFIPYRLLLAQAAPTVDPYAAYYQQAGYYPPGYYPPQAGQPAPQAQAPATDRRGRRLAGNRRSQASYQVPAQPYARITPPPPTQPQVPQPPYAYYGAPPQMPPGYTPPEGYPQQPGAYPGTVQPGQVVTPGAAQPTAYAPPSYPVPAAPVTPSEPAATPAGAPVTNGGNGKNDFNEVKDAIRAILAQRGNRGQMRARDLKEELLRKISNFSERRYGFSKFKALLNAAESAGILQIEQSGHILWVSAPGTPKMSFGAPEALDTTAIEALDSGDFEDGVEAEEESTTSPEIVEEGAIAAPEAFAAPYTEVVEPVESEAAVEAPAEVVESQPQAPAPVEERPVTLPEAPIGAHREREKAARREPAARSTGPTGPRPAILDQPYYEDVINLIDNLRNRNRWLGYELLLSNVRDYLTRQMPESEAKVQAGSILSKLLNDGIIKMAVEVHSRGARKMTVKVAHLQDDNSAVRYALESRKAQQEALTAPAPEELPASSQEPAASLEAAPTEEAATPPEYWGTHFSRQARLNRPEAEASPPEESLVVEGAAEAGNLGQEAAPVLSEEAVAVVSGEEANPTVAHEEPANEISAQSVEAEIVEAPGVTGETGEAVQGEPEHTPADAEPAPAGGYIDTVELEAGPTSENGHQTEAETKQPPAEALAPVAELDTEANGNDDPEEEEARTPEVAEVAQKTPVRRPRRRRPTPRVSASIEEPGESQSMAQVAERPRLNPKFRPHRRPRAK